MITGNTSENSFIDWLIVASKLQSAAQLTRSTRREKTPWLAILKLISLRQQHQTKLTTTTEFFFL